MMGFSISAKALYTFAFGRLVAVEKLYSAHLNIFNTTYLMYSMWYGSSAI